MTLDPDRLLGRVVGPYTLERLIGEGAFAWVYAARFGPRRPVALKVLKPRFAGDPSLQRRFRTEAETAGRLKHPNIVRILEVDVVAGLTFFSMDLFPHSLAELLDRQGPLDEDALIRMGADVAGGLAFAHAQNVVHRDINVRNVLLREDGSAVIADFGIAHGIAAAGMTSQAKVTVGTPQYMSPEQVQGHPVDGRTDIYSLGVVLYRAATGETPFRSTDWFELARMHLEERPRKPSTLRESLSPRLERVMLRCLAKDPVDRYLTAQALRDELIEIRDRDRATRTFGRSSVRAMLAGEAPRSPVTLLLLPAVALLVIAAVAALIVLLGR